MKGPRVSVLAVFALIIAAASALLTIAMFFGAGCVQGLEVSSMGTEILRDVPVYHPFFSWTAVTIGGGAQFLAILLAIAARRAIRRSGGRLVGSGVAFTAILLAVTTLVASPPAFSCGTRIGDTHPISNHTESRRISAVPRDSSSPSRSARAACRVRSGEMAPAAAKAAAGPKQPHAAIAVSRPSSSDSQEGGKAGRREGQFIRPEHRT